MIDLYMNQTAAWKQKTGTNDYNEPLSADAVSMPCRIEYKSRMIRDAKQQQFMSEVTIFTKTAVKPDDAIVLNGIDYPVLSVKHQADLDGSILFYEVML